MNKLLTILAAGAAISLAACSSGTSGNSSGPTIIGDLPDNAQIYISAPGFTLNGSESVSGTIGIIGGNTGESYTLSFNPATHALVSSSYLQPEGTPSPLPYATLDESSNCIVVAGSASQTSCAMVIFQHSAESGAYYLNPIATAVADSTEYPLESIPLTITD